MKLGIGSFNCRRGPDDDRSDAERHQDVLELTKTADEVGLDSAWVSEHHFMDNGQLSGIVPALAAMAATTDDITVGPYIAIPSFYDAVRLAEDAATISLLSNGRLVLGFGLGHRDEEFDGFGIPKEERVARTVETVRILRNAWTDGPLGFSPEFHQTPADVSVTPKPEHAPPIVLGGLAKPAVRRAAEIGDGWASGASLALPELETRVEHIGRVREREGLDGEFTIYVTKYGFVGESKADAWETMRDGYLFTRGKYTEMLPELFDGDAGWEAELKEKAIYGAPAEVAEQIDEYREALGQDIHFILRMYIPGVETDAMQRCIERLGDEVLPALG